MVSKRRPLHQNSSSKLNFRPNAAEQDARGSGTKPLPDPSSVPDILLMMVLHGCRKVIFFDTNIKVCIYLSSLFIISLLADVLPFPKTYFARKDNIFNVYFVKVAWGWTLILALPFVVLTSYTICCGKREKVIRHLMRLVFATSTWFLWTKMMFNYIESTYGKCSAKGEAYQSKSACLSKGLFWQGFDLSGHAFILVYSSLVIIEEARAVIGWDGIRDLIRNEEHARAVNDNSLNGTSLKGLSSIDFDKLKNSYETFTPYIRALFISMTFIIVLWDFMLLNTMLYFHHMVEKVLSGIIAIAMWFITYKVWYPMPKMIPFLPGEGMFKYKDLKQNKDIPMKKKSSVTVKGDLPRFMGMPLTGLRNQENVEERNGSFSGDVEVPAL